MLHQPFKGGSSFVTVSVLAWMMYSLSVVAGAVFLYLCVIESTIPFAGLLTAASFCGFFGQLLVLLSLKFFKGEPAARSGAPVGTPVRRSALTTPQNSTSRGAASMRRQHQSPSAAAAAAMIAAGTTSSSASTIGPFELSWNVIACFSLVILSIVPMTWFVLQEVMRNICAREENCSDPIRQLSLVFEPMGDPSRAAYAIATIAIFAAAPITHVFAGTGKYRSNRVHQYATPARRRTLIDYPPSSPLNPKNEFNGPAHVHQGYPWSPSSGAAAASGWQYTPFQPFRGGFKYALLQMLAWTSYSLGLIYVGYFIYADLTFKQPIFETSIFATIGGAGGFLASLLVLLSLPYFEVQRQELQRKQARKRRPSATSPRIVGQQVGGVSDDEGNGSDSDRGDGDGGVTGEDEDEDEDDEEGDDDSSDVEDDAVGSGTQEPSKLITWGRFMDGNNWWTSVSSFIMMAGCPLMVLYFLVACTKFDCEISAPASLLFDTLSTADASASASAGGASWVAILPKPTLQGLKVFSVWMVFQVALALLIPGRKCLGQVTPAGRRLEYNINGFYAWVVTHVSFLLGAYVFGVFKPTVVYDNWESLFVWATIFGLSLTVFAYVKARTFPSHPDDCKFSGSFLYDMFMGVELNPRIGNLDFKLFFNGRPGIIGWTIINLSFAAAQMEIHGTITNSMVALNILHAIYVLDFFYNESWYVRTLDIALDHFGFYLAYGDMVWLPYLYTLQSHYLVRHPVELSLPSLLGVYALGLAGYWIFRSVNHQKDYFRANKGNCLIWGAPAKYLRATYKQKDGTVRESLLLVSGWWGLARHFNYVGDLMMSLSFCLSCGTDHLLPYFYIIYMTILLVHRVHRDDHRCRGKYGKYWDQYTKLVCWKICPYVY